MSLKLLVWNIQNFTLNKIDTTIGDNISIPVGGRMPSGMVRFNSLRSDYIVNNIIDSDPDIFVLVEVISEQGVKGSLVTGKGQEGLLVLLERLRAKNEEWCLVPALKLANKVNINEIYGGSLNTASSYYELLTEGQYTEGIGVFFRSDRVDFVGPFLWPREGDNYNKTKIAEPPRPGVERGPYPEPWQQCLPEGNYYAGQYIYPSTAFNGLLKFPGIQSRVPFLTRFVEKGESGRMITLASVHFPPQYSSARVALLRLAGFFRELRLRDNEIQIIAGDYNLDFGADVSFSRGRLREYGFVPFLGAGAPSTMFRSPRDATPANYLRDLTLDNIAVRMGRNAYRVAPEITVLNRVDDPDIPTYMCTTMGQINQLPPRRRIPTFRLPMNFGYLGPAPGTSDHLAILATL